MALIPSLSEIPDLELAEGGREYDLRIIAAKATQSKRTGREGVMLVCKFQDEDNISNLIHTLWFGNSEQFNGDDEDQSLNMWRQVKDFVRAIGLDPDQDLEVADFKDVEFTAIVNYNDGINSETGEQEFQPKNEIGRIIS